MLDASEWTLLEQLMDEGHMPGLAGITRQWQRVPLENSTVCAAEAGPTAFVTGQPPSTSGYWSALRYDPSSYTVIQGPASTSTPWYADAPPGSAVVFDVPHMAVHRDLDAVQVAAWGAHGPQWPRSSEPAGLLAEIDRRFGPHPAFGADYPTCWYHADYADALADALVEGARRRVEIAAWLMARYPNWRVFVTAMSELHSILHHAQHCFDRDHPLHRDVDAPRLRESALRVVRAVDEATTSFLRALPEEASRVVFAVHGMASNTSDVGANVVLPELLVRTEIGRRHFRGRPTDAWRLTGRSPVRPRGDLGRAAELNRRWATSFSGWARTVVLRSTVVNRVKFLTKSALRHQGPSPFPDLAGRQVVPESDARADDGPGRPPTNLGAL
jgi:hypothetical protein